MTKTSQRRSFFERLKAGLEEGIQFAQGKSSLRTTVILAPPPDRKGIAPKGKMLSADAQQIAKGHAWSKHKGEFPEFSTEGEFAQHIDQIMANPSAAKNLTRGRTAFWDEKTQTVVIRDPNSPDLGTAFKPKNDKAYFDNLK
jgi:hypothetical protein